jgi:ribosome-interacting GTPase 1
MQPWGTHHYVYGRAVCRSIHRDLEKNFGYALIWGKSVKHKPQRVGKKHVLEDEDVVQIMAKK